MVSLTSYRNLFLSGFSGALAFIAPAAHAATYHYVDWQTADVAGGTAAGVITLADQSQVTVTFTALNADGSAGNLYGAQVETGTDYWSPATPYSSEEVENAPPAIDIVQLSGGQDQTYVVTLSEAIKDPTMAIVSLGQPSLPTDYDFDAPFEIVSQGAGYWGGTDTALEHVEGDILRGSEGHGTIRFLGTFSSFSWTVPKPETWHGFTFAIRTTERLEPTPPTDAGVDSGTDSDASSVSDGGKEQPGDAAVLADSGAPGDAATTTADGGELDVDIDDVIGDAAAALEAGREDSATKPPSLFDSGVGSAAEDSSSDDTTSVECSCRTVGRTSRNHGSTSGWNLLAPLVLLGVALGRRRLARSAAR